MATGSSSRPAALWRVRRLARRVRSIAVARLYRDRHRDPARAVAVLGTARSGTTWLGDLLAAGLRARIVFEPFHPGHVPEMAAFGLMPYRRPEDDDAPFLRFCHRVFSGALRGPWVDRQAERILPEGRVVKCVRANLFAAWLRRRMPVVPVVLLVRHPAAVVLSRIEAGWDHSEDVDGMLGDARLVGDHLAEHVDWARSLATEEERNALIWAIHYRVAFAQHDPADGAAIVFYEDLLADPAAVLETLYERLGRPRARVPERRLRRPSDTVRPGRAPPAATAAGATRAERVLGAEGVARVRDVVDRLGLDWVYGPGAVPTAAARQRFGGESS